MKSPIRSVGLKRPWITMQTGSCSCPDMLRGC
nr:MAG TPA: hypothetical protein [Caudoviricetes sp.]